eukprot:1204369-Rhodomonas_salina.1
MAMKRWWREDPKRACHRRRVCQACTTLADPQVNVANARMLGHVRRLEAPLDADLKARSTRPGWVPAG